MNEPQTVPREAPSEVAEVVPAGAVPVREEIPGCRGRMCAGDVHVLGPFTVPELPARHVRIYLPRDYAPERPGGSLALYLFDGQNVFDDAPSFAGGWHAHKAVEKLARAKRPAPVVIGIDHGGDSRLQELSGYEIEGKPPMAYQMLDWVTGELMPALAAELNLRAGPQGALIGGSSMGGLAALWSHFHYPRAFGGALAMSPALWVAGQAIFADVAALPRPDPSRIYLDMGAREAQGRMLPIAAAMAAALAARGWDADHLLWRPDTKGSHNETCWRRRLPKALRFLIR